MSRNPNAQSSSSDLELTDEAQLKKQQEEMTQMNRINMQMSKQSIDESMGPMWTLDAPTNNNYSAQDFVYNSQSDDRAATFNEWTRSYNDNCAEESRLRIGTKPMKYFVNTFNSPQAEPYTDFTVIGNQQAYHVRNDFERAEPTRLNALYPVNVQPFMTTPFLAQVSDSRMYSDTAFSLKCGENIRDKKSGAALSEKDFNRYNPAINAQTVQNAGQFQQQKFHDGYFDYHEPNNVIMGNSSVAYYGISSRNLMENILDLSKC